MSYYGLHIPEKAEAIVSTSEENVGDAVKNAAIDCATNDKDEPLKYVFLKKIDALQMLKIHKDARMREFSSMEDACNYAQTGYEQALSKHSDVKTCISSVEKPAFSAPTKQKLVAFRKAIESGDYELVKSLIWDNPRYLVNSGDTPTSLKEGCRYNALHVCAIYNKAEIAELILKTVSDPHFVNLLTGNKNDMKMCSELAANLLDYYLNIPEKGRLETPLHLAAKYGNVQTVKLLTSYPICKMTKNKDHNLPNQIICSRRMDASKMDFVKISDLLEKRFYVPVIRSVDNDVPPQIGEPFSTDNPPNLSNDPINPELKIQALAGPMKEQEAKKFCRRWKTPPRLGSGTPLQINNSFSTTIKPSTPLKISQENINFDSPKPQGRCLFGNTASTPYAKQIVREASENGTIAKDQWKPSLNAGSADNQNGNTLPDELVSETLYSAYFRSEMNNNPHEDNSAGSSKSTQQKEWQRNICSPIHPTRPCPFSPTGYEVFEDNRSVSITCERSFCDSPGFKERNIKITDTEKGLEVIGRKLAKAQLIEWSEYWDFLDTFTDIASPEGLRKLESFLEQRIREDEATKGSRSVSNPAVIMDEVCSAFEKIGIYKDSITDVADGNVNNLSMSQSTTPYTCVEKSLQVFAKRMTKTILHNIDNIDSISDAFLTELKRLKSLICSFKDDSRFIDVNFSKVHARFAYLISIYLQNSQDSDTERKWKVQNCFSSILLSPTRTQLHCVCERVNVFLENTNKQTLPEDLKTEAMCSKAWLAEDECECQWETNLNRKISRRNRMETRYKIYQQSQKDFVADVQKVKGEENDLPKLTEGGQQNTSQNCESGNASTDDEENEVFWSDFAGSETDEEEIWMTPPESLQEELNDEHVYSVFIYGNEPTKRDLDVLNAIFNVDININNYPNVTKWKMAVLRHTNESVGNSPHPVPNHINPGLSNARLGQQQFMQKSPIAKRLFSSPALMQKKPPLTPLNKMKGLFSTYREFLDSSPVSVPDSMSEFE